MTDLLNKLIKGGYPKEDIFHHVSDLYVYVNDISTPIINDWCKENKFNKSWHCPTFIDQITGEQMYDCAFCYHEF